MSKKETKGFWASLSEIFGRPEAKDDSLMDWEQDLVDKGEYEPYNFEEEDIDEEDYYSEDD